MDKLELFDVLHEAFNDKLNLGVRELKAFLKDKGLNPKLNFFFDDEDDITLAIESIVVDSEDEITVRTANVATIPMLYLEKPLGVDDFLKIPHLYKAVVHFDINGMRERYFDEEDEEERIYLLRSYFYDYYVNNLEDFLEDVQIEMPTVYCSIQKP